MFILTFSWLLLIFIIIIFKLNWIELNRIVTTKGSLLGKYEYTFFFINHSIFIYYDRTLWVNLRGVHVTAIFFSRPFKHTWMHTFESSSSGQVRGQCFAQGHSDNGGGPLNLWFFGCKTVCHIPTTRVTLSPCSQYKPCSLYDINGSNWVCET